MTGASCNSHWASALVDGLAAGGLVDAVISPGSRSTPLVLAVAQHPAVRVHTILDERTAGFFALGLARASGRMVALVCTSGSAGAHYLPALVEASASHVPLVVMTADRPIELQGCGAPQTIDQGGLFGVHVRNSFDLVAPSPGADSRWLRTLIARVVDAAQGVLPGPVHLNVPFRKPLWSAETAAPAARRPAARILRGPAVASPASMQALADRIRGVERGVFVCGPSPPERAKVGDRESSIYSLAEHLGWPVLAEPASQLRFSRWVNGSVISSAQALLSGAAADLEPELVVQIGQAPTSKSVAQWVARHGEGRLVLIDGCGVWRDPTHNADLLVVGEVGWVCRELRASLDEGAGTWLDTWRSAEEAAQRVLAEACGDGLWEGAVARALVGEMPEGSFLHVASSMPIRDLDTFAPSATTTVSVMANRGANGIDGTIATALGEASAWGEGLGALLMGDLAFLHDAGSLIGVEADLTIVVLNNGGGGIFGFLPIKDHPDAFEPHFLTPQRAGIAALCEAAGVRHTEVKDMAQFVQDFREELLRSGVGILEVVIDREENISRHHAAWEAVDVAFKLAMRGEG